jgi:hypothetical protein
MKVSFEEIGCVRASFAAEGSAAGQVCKMAQSGKVTPCGDGESFIGVLESVRKGVGCVLLHGFAELPCTGQVPGVGYVKLAANGVGGVKAGSGREYLVVSVDEAAGKIIVEL